MTNITREKLKYVANEIKCQSTSISFVSSENQFLANSFPSHSAVRNNFFLHFLKSIVRQIGEKWQLLGVKFDVPHV